MLIYVLKNIKHLFLKQKLLAVLLVINIVMACLVICFSYGLYSDFFTRLHEGEEEEYDYIEVYAKEENCRPLEEQKGSEEDGPHTQAVIDIKASTICDFALSLKEDTQNNLESVRVTYFYKSPISSPDKLSEGDGGYYYTGDEQPYYIWIKHYFSVKDGQIVAASGIQSGVTISEEQSINGDHVVVVDNELYNGIYGQTALGKSSKGWGDDVPSLTYDSRVLKKNTKYLLIDGEEFEIIGSRDSMGYLYDFPITALPDASALRVGGMMEEGPKCCLQLDFKGPVTRQQYEDIKKCLLQTVGDSVYLPPIKLQEATELMFYKTVILISVAIALLAAINMVILYRYILEKRASELAIFRICGCSKLRAIMAYLLECLIVNVPLFICTQIVFNNLMVPKLIGLLPNMAMAYSFKLYFAMFAIYIGVSAVVMLIMIIAMVKKHSLVALKGATKSTTRFDVMKVFEILQIISVLAILVLMVSAIVSRYEMYTPFKEYIEREGYMVTAVDSSVLPDEFEQIIGDATSIQNEEGSIYIGLGSLNGDLYEISMDGILYSDEFIDAYKPPLQDGIWLSETDDTYENSGYVPIVLTSCGGRYKVGDIFENEVVMASDNSGNPTETLIIKHKVIGVLQDNVSIASYIVGNLNPYSYTDIYAVFVDEYENNDWFMARASDEADLYGGSHGALSGIQFVFCDGMSDEQFQQIGKDLNQSERLSAIPLSIVRKNSLNFIYEQMYTLFPIAACIFILTIISTVSISAIYTKRQLRNYAIFYICGARWRTCALKSLKNGAITCAVSAVLSALILIVGKATLLKETVISFGLWHLAVCGGVIVLYLALSMIMPLTIIGSSEPREVLKDE